MKKPNRQHSRIRAIKNELVQHHGVTLGCRVTGWDACLCGIAKAIRALSAYFTVLDAQNENSAH